VQRRLVVRVNKDRSNAIADLFNAAYDEIDLEGWARDGTGHTEGPCCVGHALVRAARQRRNGALSACVRILREEVGGSIAQWNDSRHHELEVLLTLERLADRYRRD